MKSARRGTINNDARRNLINRLAVETPVPNIEKQEQSQLVIDLMNKKNKSIINEGWER